VTLVAARVSSWLLLHELLRMPEGVNLAGAGTEMTAGCPDAATLVLTLDVPDVPAGAVEVTYIYTRDNTHPDPVRLTGYDWRLADGTTLHRDLTTEDPLDPLRRVLQGRMSINDYRRSIGLPGHHITGDQHMQPTIGRIVHYALTEPDACAVNRRRQDFAAFTEEHPRPDDPGEAGATGHIGHFGTDVQAGQVFPAIVVRNWENDPGCLNLQVLLDGNDTYWVTDRVEAGKMWPSPGEWRWPARTPETEAKRVPRVGGVVHYVSYGTPGGEFSRECRAAIVTEVHKEHASSYAGGLEPVVSACVLNPTGQFFNQDIKPDQGLINAAGGTNLCRGLDYRGGTWHWPAP
jgi:hypothetical protein